MQKYTNAPVPDNNKPEATIPARFIQLPSIAETKLGAAYTAPIRLDPRALEQMQQTIELLSDSYALKLTGNIHKLLHMIDDVCHNIGESRDIFYDIIHDIRGLAGTFGRPTIGQFANSLCRYMEESLNLNSTILRFHVQAMNDAMEDGISDKRLAEETLRSLEKLILNTKAEEMVANRKSLHI